jgi:hypothetical protein
MKNLIQFFKDISADFFSEIWTFVGLFSAWLVLTGSAKVVIGKVTLVSFLIWVVTLRIRNPKGKE